MAPRVACTALACLGMIALLQGFMPAEFLPALGMAPAVLGAVARVPQIVLNFRQGHTGNQSMFTWGLSLGGNILRVITTLVDVNDVVTLAGHAIAAILNFTLVFQIVIFAANTRKVLQEESN